MRKTLIVVIIIGVLGAAQWLYVTKVVVKDKKKPVEDVEPDDPVQPTVPSGGGRVIKTDEEWKQILTPEQYHILRQKGTEKAFSGKFHDHKEVGTYICAGCGNPLFRSEAKFISGKGWPSFFKPLDKSRITTQVVESAGKKRIEVLCNGCGGHLGYLFDDGPEPTGKRYSVNSTSLDFVGEMN